MSRQRFFSDIDKQEIMSTAFRQMVDKHLVMQRYGASEKTVERLFNELGLRHVRADLIKMAGEYIQGKTVREIMVERGVSDVAISAFLRRQGIPVVKTYEYEFDINEFDSIDSEGKAYFLGLIFADGNIHKDQLTLSSNDLDVLQKFNACFLSDLAIAEVKKKAFGDQYNYKQHYKISVWRNGLADKLAQHGIYERKTSTATFPTTIPYHLMKHFVRGYMDGDGSFSCYMSHCSRRSYKERKYMLSFEGTENFLEGLRREINIHIGVDIRSNLRKRHETDNCCYSLRTSGKTRVMTILDWLYTDCNYFMNRKYIKYKGLKE